MCTHRLCELIGGGCSIAASRSRGCHRSTWTKETAPEVVDEVRALLAVIAGDRAAAVRLAQLIRIEALEERNLLAQVRDADPGLAALLAPLVRRQSR
jgi:hypothetical protein